MNQTGFDNFNNDEFDAYESQFDPMQTDRKARRSRKPQAKHKPKKAIDQIVTDIGNAEGIEGTLKTTYQPSKHEAVWLFDSLRSFFDQTLITDVLALVKGGKEASVYRCEAHSATGYDLLAAKVYRPRMFRSLSNDAMYREGRGVLTDTGVLAKETDHRLMRAIGKKTAFGVQAAHTSWLMYEYTTMERLYNAGASVPKPLAPAENAILMSYCGDAQLAAPALSEVSLDLDEARLLFREAMRNIELMLQHNMIHGDLSAYNILYWEGKITLIDFPQVTNSTTNNSAFFILERDITRVCDYFIRQGVRCTPSRIMDDLWERYVKNKRPDPLLDMDQDEDLEEDD